MNTFERRRNANLHKEVYEYLNKNLSDELKAKVDSAVGPNLYDLVKCFVDWHLKTQSKKTLVRQCDSAFIEDLKKL